MLGLLFFLGFFFLLAVCIYFQLDMNKNNKIYIEVYEQEEVRCTEEDYNFRFCFED